MYRRASDGTGGEELLFRYTAGAGFNLSDISPDGRALICQSGGFMFVVPLTGTDPLARKAIEFLRDEFNVNAGRISPDGRFLAYRSGRKLIPTKPMSTCSRSMRPRARWVREMADFEKGGVASMQFWRRDGKEFSTAISWNQGPTSFE